MNVHFWDEYRKYNSDLPVFLHNRPRDFVHHVSARWTSAQDIPACNIVQVDECNFRVTSVDSRSMYNLSFGSNSNLSMPYCECYDWNKFHWPCKHFCAIFQHVTTHGWNSLAADYRDSPFFCLDSDLIHSRTSMTTASPAPVAENADGDQSADTETGAGNNEEPNHAVRRSVSGCAKDCREILREIQDLTYLSTDASSLTVLYEQLQLALSTLKKKTPQDAGLLLAETTTQKSTRAQHSHLQNIPSRAAKSKLRRKRRAVKAEPVPEHEPEMAKKRRTPSPDSCLDPSGDIDIVNSITESVVAYENVQATAEERQEEPVDTGGKVMWPTKRARFASGCPVSSMRYYFSSQVDDGEYTKSTVTQCTKSAVTQSADNSVVNARLEAQRCRLSCSVLLSGDEAAPRPAKKLITEALRQPAGGCLGNVTQPSDFLTLLPGQWLSDNVSGVALFW